MKMMLIHPPLDDPTIPYHSTAYLKGHLHANGFDNVTMRDMNVEYVNHTFSSATVEALYAEAESRLSRLSATSSLRYQDQEMYYGLLATSGTEPSKITQAVANLRNKEALLDFRSYLESLNTLTGYLAFLGALSYPSENRGFVQMSRGRYSVASLSDLPADGSPPTHTDRGPGRPLKAEDPKP